MKHSWIATLAAAAGGVAGLAATRVRWNRRPSTGDVAMRRLTAYFVVPVWLAAGFADYLWHRRTKIETTSGLSESIIHWIMMAEAGPAVLAGLFLEINAGALAWMIALSFLHELTVVADLELTTPRRVTPAGEQVTHTFLEAPPFVVTAAAIASHWGQFLALIGRGRERARFKLRLQPPPLPLPADFSIFAAMVLFGALPHTDELRRCIQARKAGLVGQNTPACLPEVFT